MLALGALKNIESVIDMSAKKQNSDTPALQPLVITPSSRDTEKRKRKDSFVRETVSNSQAEELMQEGWELDRRLKKRTRIRREKSIDEELENRFWVLLAELGFPELNSGRNFKIRFKRNNRIEGE